MSRVRHDPALPWMAVAAGANAGVALLALGLFGAGERGTDIGLQLTARLSFLFFLAAYAGGALAMLFGPRFDAVRRRGRSLGLAFAAAQSVHVGLVAWLCWIGRAPALGVFLIFGTALFWTVALAVFSVAGVRRLAGGVAWWIVRRVGMNYVAYAFALDFFSASPRASLRYVVFYAPFVVLSVLGPVVYGLGLVKGWGGFRGLGGVWTGGGRPVAGPER